MVSCASGLIFSMSTCLICCCSSAFFCSDVGIIIVLLFMVILSIIAILSLKDQYRCTSFWTSALVAGEPCSILFDSMPMDSSSMVVSLISSALLQSRIFVHAYITFMLMPILGISLFCLFHGCAWIANLLWTVAVLICTGFLCNTVGCIILYSL